MEGEAKPATPETRRRRLVPGVHLHWSLVLAERNVISCSSRPRRPFAARAGPRSLSAPIFAVSVASFRSRHTLDFAGFTTSELLSLGNGFDRSRSK